MKRPCEETTSESDMDETIDVGSENNYSGQSTSSVIRSNSPTTTSQIMARKKRRGIIEKRRRDRINNSLSELRRLVPTAFEKQGSAKLEKAEILQMTVDHLKMLQATGGKVSQTQRNPLRSQASSATAPKGTCWSLQIESCSDCHAAEDVLGLDPNYVTCKYLYLDNVKRTAQNRVFAFLFSQSFSCSF